MSVTKNRGQISLILANEFLTSGQLKTTANMYNEYTGDQKKRKC